MMTTRRDLPVLSASVPFTIAAQCYQRIKWNCSCKRNILNIPVWAVLNVCAEVIEVVSGYNNDQSMKVEELAQALQDISFRKTETDAINKKFIWIIKTYTNFGYRIANHQITRRHDKESGGRYSEKQGQNQTTRWSGVEVGVGNWSATQKSEGGRKEKW